MTPKSWLCVLGTVLVTVCLLPASFADEICESGISCDLSVSCHTCSVGQTATFTLVCSQEVLKPCLEIEGELCCFVDLDLPSPAYYVGERLVNGSWETDADCVAASNPLMYTFQSGDEGTYRRKACRDSNCLLCSPTETITVE